MHQAGIAPSRRIRSSASGRAQCSCLPAPSSATGTSSLRRTRASISRRTAALLGASRWQIESRLTSPCARKRAVEQIGGDLRPTRRLRRLVPAEMPRHQLIGLQHAGAFGDRHLAGIEGELQRPLRGFAALPQMFLLGQHVVLDVADGQRAVAPQQPHHLARVLGLDGGEPSMAFALVQLHRRDEEAKILRRHVGQRVRPVFEHALVDALGLPQVGAPIGGDAAIENVVMAALDHVDGVDLHIAEMIDRRRDGLRPVAERRRAYRAAGRAARFAGPRLWSGEWGWSRGASRGNVVGFADVRSPRIRGWPGRHGASGALRGYR